LIEVILQKCSTAFVVVDSFISADPEQSMCARSRGTVDLRVFVCIVLFDVVELVHEDVFLEDAVEHQTLEGFEAGYLLRYVGVELGFTWNRHETILQVVLVVKFAVI